ncbi:helix-turn-helix domain-containing protein [Flavobacterium sp. RNTU_13]|uniref:helix-turn-helix domain-containing protein n=1 Tax=Flavobacterium sp. RNTU_13 TaxID=3375145 RepID=UPI003986665F
MDNPEDKIIQQIDKVSKKIKQLRKAKGFTSFEAFANEYDLDRVQYWRVESGANITLKTFFRILEIHNITPQEFFSNL